GVGETIIQRQGDNQILVQLPGITDRDKAKDIIGRVAQLEFRLVNNNPNQLKLALQGTVPKGYILKYSKDDENEPLLLEDTVALSGDTIADAKVDFDSTGFNQPYISITFNSKGANIFADVTKKNVGSRLAILLDGEVISAPNIQEPILGGRGQITGRFNFDEASILALSLRSGALPAPMRIEEERTVGPLLGKDSINDGITATIIGGALVFVFMLVYYLKAGFISSLALAMNLLLLVGTMGFLNVMMPASQLTLTLPGIAGIILTLGMAVDANVLINERIREEINNGRPIQAAINNGFNKALKAIVDSNTTTLIAAFMLFQFGSGPIKGFAVTLSIGLATSLFTALFVTRTFFNFFYQLNFLKSLPMLKLLDNTKIDFVSKRIVCFILSGILIIGSVIALVQKKDSAYGIDFVGGQIQEFRFEQRIDADHIRESLKSVGLNDAVIQQFDLYPTNVLIRTSEQGSDEKVIQAFDTSFPENKYEILRIEQVGPVVGKALQMAAILAIVFALGGILIYVGFRFKHFDFATAGVIALLHDVFITLGILIMMNRQVDLLVVTALLTIAGYSINDTIIIYDRVRENMSTMKKTSLAEIINLSINQTLSRTLLTTLTTLLVVATLYFKGGEVLNTFALCLLIGFIAGTYSTIFIASPLVLAWEKKRK
ncbi:MAG: protein translocase subunit SecD, partial [Candidatus Omnitrophica bacterium]|nr:protein translocase subunit SecD [Candidatus Omnitrophota bacterium]